MEKMGVVLDPQAKNLTFKRRSVMIPAQLPREKICQISAAAFKLWHNRSKERRTQAKPKMFSASLAGIEKPSNQSSIRTLESSCQKNIGIIYHCLTDKKQRSFHQCEEKGLTIRLSLCLTRMENYPQYPLALSTACREMN